tara:strand:+ start:25455 stop:26336 length:882 start_codon:yes stop_codon:yes gene_type:complete
LEKIILPNPKILVLGVSGMIGHVIYDYLKQNDEYDLHGLAGSRKFDDKTKILDVMDSIYFEKYIKFLNPNIVINCIGLLIEDSKNNIKDSIYLNAFFPHYLKKLAKEIDFKLIHISTDCVFSGDTKFSYKENDFKDGRSVYAKTKSLGEIIDNINLTLRTSVVGPELKSSGGELFNWFMSQKEEIFGYTNAYWSGISSIELAKAVKWSIDNSITGLYNLTNCEKINKYDLLKLFSKYSNKKISIKPTETRFSDKSFLDTRKLIDYKIPDYDKMIADLIKYISLNKKLYPHYKI